jgi:hypothetical protein
MQKLNAFALAISAALVLTACGGGSDSTPAAGNTSTGGTTGTGGTTTGASTASVTNPLNADYTDYYYLQDLAAAGTTATFTDKGVGVAGTVSVRGSSITMTPASDGGVGYGSPITAGVAVGSNTADTNLPAIALLCQSAASMAQKGTDVLVAASATRLLKASDLAGQSFSVFREDCAVTSGFSFAVDSAGNATMQDSSGIRTLAAADFTQALTGSLIPITGGSIALVAYSYKKIDGSTAYAVLEHGSPSTTGLARGFLGLWSQQ